jgi:tellurite resistance protein TehA-like permease
VNDGIIAAVMLTELMNLGVAIMAAGDTVIRAGFFYLFVLQPAKFQALFFHAGLEEAAAAATAIIVGPVGSHINKIFFTDDRFDHKSQIFGNRFPITLAHDLTGILHGKFNFQVLVPIGIYLELSLADPFSIVFIDVLDDKVMLDVEFFQSCQD